MLNEINVTATKLDDSKPVVKAAGKKLDVQCSPLYNNNSSHFMPGLKNAF